MAWDFAEAKSFADRLRDGLEAGPVRASSPRSLRAAARRRSPSSGCDASRRRPRGLISTDPPYYDNIGYSDLSDFFYVWLRRSLRERPPRPSEHDARPEGRGARRQPVPPRRQGRREGVLRGRLSARVRARPRDALADFPITVYYAFKQSDAGDDGTVIDGLGDAARRDDPLGLGDHRDLADAQRARQPDAQSARTPSPPRSSSRCARAPTTRRRPTAAASSPRCTTSCPTRCASSSRARSRRSTCRRPRSAPGWRCSRATRRSSRTTARR